MKLTLKAARINVGMNQEEAAKKIEVSKDIISKWERGICMPNSKNIPKIEKAYNITYDNIYFFTK